MKITVKAEDLPFDLNIPIPNVMIGSRLLTHVLRNFQLPFDLDSIAGRELKRCLQWMRKNHPGVPLVEVKASTGEEVTIMP